MSPAARPPVDKPRTTAKKTIQRPKARPRPTLKAKRKDKAKAKPKVERPRARPKKLSQDVDTTVLIDYRRGSVELLKYPPFDRIGEKADITNAKGEPAGDVCFTGNGPNGKMMVGVELKSITDLVGSMQNGRVQGTQLPVMLDEYESVWLVVYGEYRAAPGSHCLQIKSQGEWRNHYIGNNPVPYGYLQQFVIGLQEIGVNVITTTDLGQAAAAITELVKWRTKDWLGHKSLRAFDRSRKVTAGTGQDRQSNRTSLMPVHDELTLLKANTALQWPALGYERALVAANHFPTIVDMVNATAEEWAELVTTDRKTGKTKRFGPGVGDAVWRAIRWAR